MAINISRNKRNGPEGGTRRLHLEINGGRIRIDMRSKGANVCSVRYRRKSSTQ